MESENGWGIKKHRWMARFAPLALLGVVLHCATGLLAQGQSGASEASSQGKVTTPAITAGPPAIATGPEVGQKIPYFRARDQYGRWQDFHSIRGPKGAVLECNRSADW